MLLNCDIDGVRIREVWLKKQLFSFSPSRFAQLSIKKQASMDTFIARSNS